MDVMVTMRAADPRHKMGLSLRQRVLEAVGRLTCGSDCFAQGCGVIPSDASKPCRRCCTACGHGRG